MDPQTRENYNTIPKKHSIDHLRKQDTGFSVAESQNQGVDKGCDNFPRTEVHVTTRCAIVKVYKENGDIVMYPARRFEE